MGARSKAIWGPRLESRVATCSRWLKGHSHYGIQEMSLGGHLTSKDYTRVIENEDPLLAFQSVYMKGPGPASLTLLSEVI